MHEFFVLTYAHCSRKLNLRSDIEDEAVQAAINPNHIQKSRKIKNSNLTSLDKDEINAPVPDLNNNENLNDNHVEMEVIAKDDEIREDKKGGVITVS